MLRAVFFHQGSIQCQ